MLGIVLKMIIFQLYFFKMSSNLVCVYYFFSPSSILKCILIVLKCLSVTQILAHMLISVLSMLKLNNFSMFCKLLCSVLFNFIDFKISQIRLPNAINTGCLLFIVYISFSIPQEKQLFSYLAQKKLGRIKTGTKKPREERNTVIKKLPDSSAVHCFAQTLLVG